MYCTKKITNDLIWVGGNDRRLAMFEGVYAVPRGVSYNSYLLTDDTTVLFDTVDKAVSRVFFENIEHVLDGRRLDYVVVQHMEPDHSATLSELLFRYPEVTVVCNQKTANMMQQFFGAIDGDRFYIVNESSVLHTGRHELHFVMAPMVHWPEVMVTYDATDKILFSADAFGTFGALNGAIFADEVDFMRDYLDEARRYYTNIVGKYGTQVEALLRKAGALEIEMICPLHGFVFRKNIGDYIDKYMKWSRYEPEENGVMIAYASVYGHTENAVDVLAARLRDRGIAVTVFDTSVTPSSEILAAAFRYSHLVFASTTYNAGIFISMDELLRDIQSHNLQNRTVAFIENGSWAPTSGKLMREIMSSCKNMTFLDTTLSIRSAMKKEQEEELLMLADAIADSFPKEAMRDPYKNTSDAPVTLGEIDPTAAFKLSYGLFVVSTRDGGKDNGCIINTAQLFNDNPQRITVSVNKGNLTHDMIKASGVLNISVLTEDAPFEVFRHFGFQSGRETDKFENDEGISRSANGCVYLTAYTNAVISGRVVDTLDSPTHTLFVLDVTEAHVLSDRPSVTYAYYFAHIKPRPAPAEEDKVGYVCKICGYVYEGEELPKDFVCPLCKHGPADFEKLGGK